MNIFIKTLDNQIETLKDNVSTLIGNCSTILEFSNVPLFEDTIQLSETEEAKLIEINKELQRLCNILIDVKEEIYKL